MQNKKTIGSGKGNSAFKDAGALSVALAIIAVMVTASYFCGRLFITKVAGFVESAGSNPDFWVSFLGG